MQCDSEGCILGQYNNNLASPYFSVIRTNQDGEEVLRMNKVEIDGENIIINHIQKADKGYILISDLEYDENLPYNQLVVSYKLDLDLTTIEPIDTILLEKDHSIIFLSAHDYINNENQFEAFTTIKNENTNNYMGVMYLRFDRNGYFKASKEILIDGYENNLVTEFIYIKDRNQYLLSYYNLTFVLLDKDLNYVSQAEIKNVFKQDNITYNSGYTAESCRYINDRLYCFGLGLATTDDRLVSGYEVFVENDSVYIGLPHGLITDNFDEPINEMSTEVDNLQNIILVANNFYTDNTLYISKFNTDFQLLWQVLFNNGDTWNPRQLSINEDGDIFIAGRRWRAGLGHAENFLLKIFSDGQLSAINDTEFDPNDMRIYPNPSSSYIIIDAPKLINNAQIIINDINGSIIKRIESYQNKQPIDIQDLAAGTYLLSIINEEGQIYSQRFIKN